MAGQLQGKYTMATLFGGSQRCWVVWGLVLVLSGVFVGCTGPAVEPDRGGLARVDPGDSDDFTVVDCLLPGQVRQLGTRTTYVTARRPIKTTAEDCTIRGGEYVAADRADYSTALQVWLETAQEGNAEAQYYVGTLYEKGPRGGPDYGLAAVWYRKAADQGYGRAAINLGRLYEQGLGVNQNSPEAYQWYARSSGLSESSLSHLLKEEAGGLIKTLEMTVQAREGEIRRLREDLKQSGQRLSQLQHRLKEQTALAGEDRRQLQQVDQRYQQVQAKLQQVPSDADGRVVGAHYEEELQSLQQDLGQRQTLVQERDAEIALLQEKISGISESGGRFQSLQETVTKREQEIKELRQELLQASQELSTLTGQLRDRTNLVEQDGRKFQLAEGRYRRVKAELDKARSLERALANPKQHAALQRKEEELEMLRQDLAQRQERLKEKNEEVAGLEKKIATLESRERDRDVRLASVASVDLGLEGPTIEILDPPIVIPRGIQVARNRKPLVTRVGVQRSITGRVTAPAGLQSLLVNGQPSEVGSKGLFTVDLPLLRSKPDRLPVDILAVDIQNKRAVTRLVLVPPGTTLPAPDAPLTGGMDFGRYFALVIGNDHYQHWEPLNNAVADAMAVADVLHARYGFQVTILKNATRKDLLKALNAFRKTLTEKDNLLIYYAGHGYLEPNIDRGYWIPVDAELHDNSDWILLPTITDLLQLMSAKHVLVVADSCFSGKLTRTSLAKLRPGLTDEARMTMLKTLAQKRVRTALTSGGIRPVLDTGGQGHSVFATAFLAILKDNTSLLETERLFWAVRSRVIKASAKLNVEQIPTYAPVQFAGHESLGDFIFVPSKS